MSKGNLVGFFPKSVTFFAKRSVPVVESFDFGSTHLGLSFERRGKSHFVSCFLGSISARVRVDQWSSFRNVCASIDTHIRALLNSVGHPSPGTLNTHNTRERRVNDNQKKKLDRGGGGGEITFDTGDLFFRDTKIDYRNNMKMIMITMAQSIGNFSCHHHHHHQLSHRRQLFVKSANNVRQRELIELYQFGNYLHPPGSLQVCLGDGFIDLFPTLTIHTLDFRFGG